MRRIVGRVAIVLVAVAGIPCVFGSNLSVIIDNVTVVYAQLHRLTRNYVLGTFPFVDSLECQMAKAVINGDKGVNDLQVRISDKGSSLN